MKQIRKIKLLVMLVVVLSVAVYVVTYATVSENDAQFEQLEAEEDCTFCDGHELTMKEKYEELLWKALTDEDNLLDEGIITQEVYELQCEPFNELLDSIDSLSDEELKERYLDILYYHLDENAEYEADGEEIDKEFVSYIESELSKIE